MRKASTQDRVRIAAHSTYRFHVVVGNAFDFLHGRCVFHAEGLVNLAQLPELI